MAGHHLVASGLPVKRLDRGLCYDLGCLVQGSPMPATRTMYEALQLKTPTEAAVFIGGFFDIITLTV
jgi:hypothetical protein